jgi:hypothetical protein
MCRDSCPGAVVQYYTEQCSLYVMAATANWQLRTKRQQLFAVAAVTTDCSSSSAICVLAELLQLLLLAVARQKDSAAPCNSAVTVQLL